MSDGTPCIRNHVIATPWLLVRGNVLKLATRLTENLRLEGRPHLRVVDAEVHFLAGDSITEHPETTIMKEDVSWAHEFVALAGDHHQRRLYEPTEETRVSIWFTRPEGLRIQGIVPLATLAAPSEWMVVRAPIPESHTSTAERHAEAIQGLPWVVCHLQAVSAIADIGTGDPDLPQNEEFHG